MATTTEERHQTSLDQQQGDKVEADEETPLLNKKTKENTQRSIKLQVALCLIILITELCERLAYYSMSVTLVLYCQIVLQLRPPLPSQIVLGFMSELFYKCKNSRKYKPPVLTSTI